MIQKLRCFTQIIFLVFFIILGVWPTLLPGGDHLFRWDFVTVASAAISARVFIGALFFSALLVLVTFIWGRIFCGWACPLGTLADFLDFIFHFGTRGERLKAIKYHILWFCLVVALLGVPLVWALDPLVWATRILGVVSSGFVDYHWFFILSGLFMGLHFAFGRRAFCRILCPLGAGLGIIARHSLLERRLNTSTCTECNLCVINNRSFAIGKAPDIYNSAECFQCRECETICPEKSLSFGYAKRATSKGAGMGQRNHIPVVELSNTADDATNSSRRLFLANTVAHGSTLAAGVLTGVALRRNSAYADNAPDFIRPPGAVIENEFINRCIRCNACFRACPTETLVPSSLSNGLLTYGTPVLDPRSGGCLYECNACGEACPTGAISALALQEKQKLKMGFAKVNAGSCIPHQTGMPCTSCAAVCPYDAINWVPSDRLLPWDDQLLYPEVIPDRCTGCGLCEAACPVEGMAAINVVPEYPRGVVEISEFKLQHKPVGYFKIHPPT